MATAAGAAEAFARLSEEPFDVLVSDIAMPAEDRHSLARRIRARDDEMSQIPAVALTAYGGPLQRQLPFPPASTNTKKPFVPEDLLRAVAAASRRSWREAPIPS